MSRRNTTSDRGLHCPPRQVQLPSTRELKEKRFTQVGKGVAPWKAHKNGRGSKQGLWMGSTENTNVRSKFALQSEVLSLLLSQLDRECCCSVIQGRAVYILCRRVCLHVVIHRCQCPQASTAAYVCVCVHTGVQRSWYSLAKFWHGGRWPPST